MAYSPQSRDSIGQHYPFNAKLQHRLWLDVFALQIIVVLKSLRSESYEAEKLYRTVGNLTLFSPALRRTALEPGSLHRLHLAFLIFYDL
jgi:hypothetical protein